MCAWHLVRCAIYRVVRSRFSPDKVRALEVEVAKLVELELLARLDLQRLLCWTHSGK